MLDKAALIKLRNKLSLYSDKRIILGVVICVLAVYLDYTLILKRQFRTAATLKTKIIQLKKDLAVFGQDLKNMQEFKNKQAASDLGQDARMQKLISEDKISVLLEDISNLATKFDIKIIQVKPNRLSVAQEKNPLLVKFTAFLISLDLLCDYHNLGKFISALEQGSVFISLENLRISQGQTDYLTQRVSLTLKTYVRK
jgi:Tfp pilus assembly protein PilO